MYMGTALRVQGYTESLLTDSLLQETKRTSVSENVDERTRFEMYYPPFQGAIDAG